MKGQPVSEAARGCSMPVTASSSWFQPVPPQATAEPISGVSDATGKACLRKSKRLPGARIERKSVRNGPGNSKAREEGEGRGAPGPEQRFPCSLWRDCRGADISLQPIESILPVMVIGK